MLSNSALDVLASLKGANAAIEQIAYRFEVAARTLDDYDQPDSREVENCIADLKETARRLRLATHSSPT